MDRDSILSRDEIDALLSAIRSPEAAEPELAPVDFSRPRRLNPAQLDKLRELHRPLLDAVAGACKKWLNAPVQVRFLDPAESTPAELLKDRPADGLLARAGDVLVDPSPEVAFALVERSLGGRRLSRPPDRPLRDLEAELIAPALVEILDLLKPAWAGAASADLRWGTCAGLAGEIWPEGAYALIAVEVLAEGLLGDVLFAVPAAAFEPVIARPAVADPAPDPGVNIEVAARFPLGALRLADLRGLAAGDLLVWPGDAAPGLIVEVSRRPHYAGRPGTLSGQAAVELLRVAGQEPAPVRLTRIPGGGVSSGVTEVPLEIRAVLAERLLSLRELGELRPGARIEFPRPADAPVELRLGRRVVGRGPLLQSRDKLAVRIESHRDSGAPRL